jgi:hypothetical protein
MISEVKEGALFYSTVPRRPFEIERTGGTEVIVRHGRERRVGSVGLVRVKNGEARGYLCKLGAHDLTSCAHLQ